MILVIERDTDGEYIVTDLATVVYGNAATINEAIADYWESLAEYRDFLAAARRMPGPWPDAGE